MAGQGHARLRAAGIAVDVGLGAEEARRAHAGHIRRIRDGRPHVILKLAVSADGKAGLAGRRPVRITGEAARERVHLMRAQNDAVLTGIGTALADDPLLTCRLPGMEARSPVRVVLDAGLRLPPSGRLATSARPTSVWVVGATGASPANERALRGCGVGACGRGPRQPARSAGGVAAARRARHHPADGRGRADRRGGISRRRSRRRGGSVPFAKPLGEGGIDALTGLPLTALTQSPRLRIGRPRGGRRRRRRATSGPDVHRDRLRYRRSAERRAARGGSRPPDDRLPLQTHLDRARRLDCVCGCLPHGGRDRNEERPHRIFRSTPRDATSHHRRPLEGGNTAQSRTLAQDRR